MIFIAAIATTLLLAVAGTARAQEKPAAATGRPRPSGPAWSIGMATTCATAPYAGQDTRFMVIPYVTYTGERLSITGPQAAWKLGRAAGVSCSVEVRYQFDPYDDDDSYELRGMLDRDGTVYGGLGMRYPLGRFTSVRGEALTDLLGVHDGQQARLSLQRVVPVGTWGLIPSIGAHWQSSQTADYLYGVRASESMPDRPAYRVDATLSGEAGVRIVRPLPHGFGLMLATGVEWLNDDIRRSPIVDDAVVFRGMAGLTYGLTGRPAAQPKQP